jgi:hypothetical protein
MEKGLELKWLGGLYWKGRLALFGSYLEGLPHTHFVIVEDSFGAFVLRKTLWLARQLKDAGGRGVT